MICEVNCDLQKKLEEELYRLRGGLKLGYELKVRWLPNHNEKLSGEVKGEIIFVYDDDEKKALDTLRHEVIDYILTKELISPSQKLINKLIALHSEVLYERKERVVEKILEVLFDDKALRKR